MLWPPTRFWALAVVVFLFAAQVHVLVEASPARTSGHLCQYCLAGAWADVSTSPDLGVALRSLRLEPRAPQLIAKHCQTEASAPRAPPLA